MSIISVKLSFNTNIYDMGIYVPNSEELGRKRFPDNKAFRKRLSDLALDILNQIQQKLLASNYPKDNSTNLAIFNSIQSRELARLRLSMEAINNDKQYTQTRPQFLQQILGERLLLGTNIAPLGYNDETYRKYLISIKDADLAGSRKTTLEELASEMTGQTVNIKELYLDTRAPNSSLDVTDTHKMIVEVLIDILQPGQDINSLLNNLSFFINLVKPAHVLYDTKLIWTEQIDINKIHDIIFGDTGGGCVPVYDYLIRDDEPSYLALQVFILPGPLDSQGNPATGLIDSIHHDNQTFYFDDSRRVITDPGVTQYFDVNGRQVTFSALEIGQYVKMTYQIIPGEFQFWNTPTIILPTTVSQYYRDVYRRPLFQETVKKIMDAQGRFPLQIKTTPTTLCDRWVQDALQPLYEDLRGNCNAGHDSSVVFNDTLYVLRGFPELSFPYPGPFTDPSFAGSEFTQFMDHTSITDASGAPASISSIGLTINSLSISNGIYSVDSSAGRLQLQTDDTYWDNSSGLGRFPVAGDNLLFDYYRIDGTNVVPASTNNIFGIKYWQLPRVPAVNGDGSGTLATPDQVHLFVDGTAIQNAVISLDPLLGHVVLQDSSSFWINSALGRVPLAERHDYFTFDKVDTTLSTIELITPNYFPTNTPITFLDMIGDLPAPLLTDTTYYSIRFDSLAIQVAPIPDGSAIVLLTQGTGKHRVDVQGDLFTFKYILGERYQYGLLFDDPARYMDSYINSDPFAMVFDGDTTSSAVFEDQPVTIGYRYRTYLLHHSSVLNSPDTLLLNEYQKPAKRASIANQEAVLNHKNLFFSGEFLNDTNPVPQPLSDAYLDNGLDPILKLHEGTPTFQQTFSYQPNLIYQKKLQDVRKNHRLLLYSDLLLKEFIEGNEAVDLSSICDNSRTSFKTRIKEDLTHIAECAPWELFDTVETLDVDVSIPGNFFSLPNLRIDSTKLRENFILRGVESTGTATVSASFVIPAGAPITSDSTTFQLPASFDSSYNDDIVSFPALPVVDFFGNLATTADITCKVNGVDASVIALDPITGVVTVEPLKSQITSVHYVTLTAHDVAVGEISVPGFISDPGKTSVSVVQGVSQYLDQDFSIDIDKIRWKWGTLEGILSAGDVLRISYEVYPYVVLSDFPFLGIKFEFTYKIPSHAVVTVVDHDYSRIMDDGYVFPSICYDREAINLAWAMDEHYVHLSDFSDGIKLKFFNIDTLQVEDHIFSGPVFELYDASQDQIGVPSNIPNAVVRIANPLSATVFDIADYDYLNDALVRFRKKTYKELLPSRTFRTIELTEVLPV